MSSFSTLSSTPSVINDSRTLQFRLFIIVGYPIVQRGCLHASVVVINNVESTATWNMYVHLKSTKSISKVEDWKKK